MVAGGKADRARQFANVAGALFQVLAGFLMPFAVAARGGAPVRPLIQPANYAFVIWAPIFLLCLACAIYQALPANRENPLLRRAGWFTSGAFLANGLFEVAVSMQQFVLAQGFIVGAVFCAGVAYLRLAHAEPGVLRGAERALLALPVGLFFGWLTAATVVNAAGVAVLLGVPEGGWAEILLGCLLLLSGSLFASAIIRTGAYVPAQGYLAYAAAILWALLGIAVAQSTLSLIAGVALVASIPIVLASVRRGGWWRGQGLAGTGVS